MTGMFYVKKLISQFLYPMPFCLCLGIIGLYLLWFTNRQRAGKLFVTISIALLTLLGYGFVSDAALESLEQRYPGYQTDDSSAEYIVVLGGGRSRDARLSVTNQLSQAAAARLMEGLRIYRNQPGSKMVFSGYQTGKAMAEAAAVFGVNKDDIIFDNAAPDTINEAINISALIGKKPVILVTSASHLARSVSLFEKYGMSPHPAPADYHIRKDPEISVSDFFPRTRALFRSEIAIHEYAGIFWGKIRNIF